MYQNFELYNPCVILSAPIIIINHLLNVSYFGYILHTRLKSYISKFGAVQSLDNFICINNTYQPFAETFLFWLNPARKIQSTIGYHNLPKYRKTKTIRPCIQSITTKKNGFQMRMWWESNLCVDKNVKMY